MKRKGFTLMELLVVIAIIGLLSTVAMVTLSTARQKARDAKRLADVKQIQTALELYYNNFNSYPMGDIDNSRILGDENDKCLGADGFSGSCEGTVYIKSIPAYPTPPADGSYLYSAYLTGGDCTNLGDKCSEYKIIFDLERVSKDIGSGNECEAAPSGLRCCQARPCS